MDAPAIDLQALPFEAAALGPLEYDARVTVTPWQRRLLVILAILVGAVFLAAAFGFTGGLLVLVGLVTALYLIDLLFCAYLVTSSMRQTNRHPRSKPHDRKAWPTFTVLCPMYQETAVLPQLVDALTRLDYPADSLQVLLLLEEDDVEGIQFARRMNLPSTFEVVVVSDGQPKTKPKACNYGLQVARGEYVVIFDAEDVPERDQLKKAVLGFEELPHKVACLQAPLNFYNPRQNVLTRLFTAEYSLWFDLILEGLQRLNGPIPLGGTSNHFRTEVLRGLGGWDPYNVTEDADLGIRLYKQGFRTGMLDSTTYEEANANVRNWIRQRSRWIKGYLQTLLVHTRGGWDLPRTRDPNFLTFLLIVGAKALVNYINPLMWALTLSYFLLRNAIGKGIESLYPAPIFYTAVVTLVFGNLLFLYTFLLGSARRGNHDLIKYGLLAPFYWLMMSVAAAKALGQLIGRPHYWEKTVHGLHLATAGSSRPPADSAAPGRTRHDQLPGVQPPRQRDPVGRHRVEELNRPAGAAEPARRAPLPGHVHPGALRGQRPSRYEDQ
jgi:cellulose synthase/poly-beta-1,6-N-acetylglucosamine synthase-like glycosyltransferase